MSKSGGGSSLSSGVQDKYQRISWGEIRHVQNLIERCVQRYMTQVRLLWEKSNVRTDWRRHFFFFSGGNRHGNSGRSKRGTGYVWSCSVCRYLYVSIYQITPFFFQSQVSPVWFGRNSRNRIRVSFTYTTLCFDWKIRSFRTITW